MICQECGERPATLHFTKIINGEKTEFHMCEKCAQEKGEFFLFNGSNGFSINNLLAGLLNIEPSFKKTQHDPFQHEDVLQCKQCSMTYPQFVQVGRFGCANCYEAFKDLLNPILRRLHSGNSNHIGKIPKRIGGSMHVRKKIEELKGILQQLISSEQFEQAAEIRDEIRSLEKKLAHEGGE